MFQLLTGIEFSYNDYLFSIKFLPDFQDVVELMYGGEVELKESNIKTILKFSTLFQIQEMYNLCLDWVTQHISTLNLFALIELGLLIQRIGEGNNDVLDICTIHIKGDVKDELSEMSKGWVIVNNFVKFLVQEDILYYTLPVLTTWVANDVNVKLILAEFEVKGLGDVLWEYGERYSDLMEKMGEKVELLETSKQLQKVQSQNFRRSVSARVKVPKTEKVDLASLLAEDYKAFSLEKIMSLEENYKIDHVEVVDIALSWILTNVPTQLDLDKLWKCFKLSLTAPSLLAHVRNSILHMNTTVVIPYVSEISTSQYKYLTLCKELRTYKDLSSLELVANCRHCSIEFSFKVKFIKDKLPCWEITSEGSHAIKSLYINLYRPQKNGCYYSLLTNNLTSFQVTVAELWGLKGSAYINWLLDTCPDK